MVTFDGILYFKVSSEIKHLQLATGIAAAAHWSINIVSIT